MSEINALATEVLQLARQRNWKIATAESCTGGLVSGVLTAIAGSSDVVACGFVTYSNEAKMRMLDVSDASLEKYGAVSETVAQEMALGAVQAGQVDLAVSVTGLAGPGGSEHKPEGLVCFATAGKNGLIQCQSREFGAIGRHQVRRNSVREALWLLREAIPSAAP